MKHLSLIIYNFFFFVKFVKSIDFTDLQWHFTVKDRSHRMYVNVSNRKFRRQNIIIIIIIIIIICLMELSHLLTRSGLTYLEVSSEVCHDSFCKLGNSVSLSWVVCHEAFCLHAVSSSSCIPVVYLEPVLFLILLQCVNLFCNLPKCILLFFSYISSLLLLFSWHPLH